MSISAMKQALDAIETYGPEYMHGLSKKHYIKTLRQAIAEAEKQEPLVWMNKYGHVASFKNDEYTAPLYTAPVHAIDISQERVDETAKSEHEWVGLTDEEEEDILKGSKNAYDAIKSIEAKLKEKNT